uniref:D-alanine-D-alanine ligase n=1 Tax=Rhizophora mucronata TaxID=61149 RepID=A0A2P2MLT3_RHIMU
MWDLVLTLILSFFCQLRWSFNFMEVLMWRKQMQFSTIEGSIFQQNRLLITLHLVFLWM